MNPEVGQIATTYDDLQGIITSVQNGIVGIKLENNQTIYKYLKQITILYKPFEKTIKGISLFSGEPIEIIGEETYLNKENKIIEQYVYHIVGKKPENGKPFISLKENIILENK